MYERINQITQRYTYNVPFVCLYFRLFYNHFINVPFQTRLYWKCYLQKRVLSIKLRKINNTSHYNSVLGLLVWRQHYPMGTLLPISDDIWWQETEPFIVFIFEWLLSELKIFYFSLRASHLRHCLQDNNNVYTLQHAIHLYLNIYWRSHLDSHSSPKSITRVTS